MYNPYVTTLLLDLQRGLEDCRNFKRTLEDFLHDYPFVEEVNKNFPTYCVVNAIERANSLESAIEEFKNVLKENINKDE